jgi:hypothetical protein
MVFWYTRCRNMILLSNAKSINFNSNSEVVIHLRIGCGKQLQWRCGLKLISGQLRAAFHQDHRKVGYHESSISTWYKHDICASLAAFSMLGSFICMPASSQTKGCYLVSSIYIDLVMLKFGYSGDSSLHHTFTRVSLWWL